MKNFYFLRVGNDYLNDAQVFRSKAAAIEAYKDSAQNLARYGQTLEATIHIGPHIAELTEYPDFILTLGPRGGVRIEKA